MTENITFFPVCVRELSNPLPYPRRTDVYNINKVEFRGGKQREKEVFETKGPVCHNPGPRSVSRGDPRQERRVLQPELLCLNIFVASLISSGEEEKGESLLHTPFSLSLFSDALLRSLA